MPRYDLQCPACAHRWECTRGMNQDNPPCPSCGHPTPEQLPAVTSFVLAGSGWAKDGYSKRKVG